jgi:hypothetical protein
METVFSSEIQNNIDIFTAVRTSNPTTRLHYEDKNWLMLFKEIIAVNNEIHAKHIYNMGKMQSYCTLKYEVHIVTTEF